MSKTLSMEEMERHHIFDIQEFCETINNSAVDITLHEFLEITKSLAAEVNKQAFIFSPETAVAFTFKAFYDLGVWQGALAYREAIVNAIGGDAEQLKNPPFQLDQGAISAFVLALDNSPSIVKQLCDMLQLQVLEE